ncbi:hypothetical protein C8R46DRAFT_1093642 [Mycena filopes]|nr:hypothetical protein C8R46DRAFT_1093642 [Mycena filopes]
MSLFVWSRALVAVFKAPRLVVTVAPVLTKTAIKHKERKRNRNKAKKKRANAKHATQRKTYSIRDSERLSSENHAG